MCSEAVGSHQNGRMGQRLLERWVTSCTGRLRQGGDTSSNTQFEIPSLPQSNVCVCVWPDGLS